MQSKIQALGILLFAEVAAMSTWFATSASLGAMKAQWAFSPFHAALLTSSVQAGFVAGTLTSALFCLADRLDLRRLFGWSALVAGLATLSIPLFEPISPVIPALRFLAGVCMAGVYPVGMAIAATWAAGDLGLLIGLLVAALTFGSAAPHLAAATAGLDWKVPCLVAGLASLTAAGVIQFLSLGPNAWPAPKFRLSNVLEAWGNRPLRMANLGYLGHMWELYAMWAWIGAFVAASLDTRYGSQPPIHPSLAAFLIIASGTLGAFAGGWGADRFGRTAITSWSMLVSGSCALLIGLSFGASAILLLAIGLVWGVSIIADSAQFSAAVAELSDGNLRGTMLTIQTSVGFLLTLVSIHLMPYAVDLMGWRYAFAMLAIGPYLGTVAMLMLRQMPESIKIAGGRR